MSISTDSLNLKAASSAAASARGSTLEEVFRKHFRVVYETALHITGSSYDADDVVQNTFLQLIRNNRLHLLENPAGYLRRAATNQALKLVSNRSRLQLVADSSQFEKVPVESAAGHDPESAARRLLEFIQTLKPAAALMLKLRYVEGLSNWKIAEMLGKSEPVVAMTLYRLRRRLKTIGKGEL